MHLPKLIECATQKVNCSVNYELWMMMIQCRFMDCNKCTTMVGDVGIGGGYACAEARVHGKSLYRLLNFAVNLNLKNKLLKYKKSRG